MKKKSAYWFWAWILLCTYKANGKSKNPRCLIWKNLILVSGYSASDVLAKTMRIGKANESTPEEQSKLDGKLAVTRFLGIVDMGVIHDGIEDGCELYFRESRSSFVTARRSIPPTTKILRAVTEELRPYQRIRWNPHAQKRIKGSSVSRLLKNPERD